MLNTNNNIIFTSVVFIILAFIELFHFGSDVYIIIMSESFLCFFILLNMLSFIFQEMFILGTYIITFKYIYIYILFKNIINLYTNVYPIFINEFYFFLFFFIKIFKLHKNFKNNLKFEYLKTILFLKIKNKLNNYFENKNFNYNLNLFI